MFSCSFLLFSPHRKSGVGVCIAKSHLHSFLVLFRIIFLILVWRGMVWQYYEQYQPEAKALFVVQHVLNIAM